MGDFHMSDWKRVSTWIAGSDLTSSVPFYIWSFQTKCPILLKSAFFLGAYWIFTIHPCAFHVHSIAVKGVPLQFLAGAPWLRRSWRPLRQTQMRRPTRSEHFQFVRLDSRLGLWVITVITVITGLTFGCHRDHNLAQCVGVLHSSCFLKYHGRS